MHMSFLWYLTQVFKTENEDKDIKNFIKHIDKWTNFSPKTTLRDSSCILFMMLLDVLEQNTQASEHFNKIEI